jgi:hypothetical protein
MCARTERKEQLDSVRAARAEERVTCSMFCTQREETRGKQLVANNKHLSVGLARTKDIRFVYGNFGRPITKYTVKYGVYIYGSGQPYLLVLRALLIEWGGVNIVQPVLQITDKALPMLYYVIHIHIIRYKIV